MAEINPYIKVYDTIADALEVASPLASLVAAGNRIRFDQAARPDPEKQNIQDADVPEWQLEPAPGGGVQYYAASNTHLLTQVLALRITTGDLRVNRYLYHVKWAAVRAIGALQPNIGLSFVRDVRVIDATETRDDDIANRGREGWSCIMMIEVDIQITRSQLASGLTE